MGMPVRHAKFSTYFGINMDIFFARLFHMTDWLPTLLSGVSDKGDDAVSRMMSLDDFDGVDQWESFSGDLSVHHREEVFHGSLQGFLRHDMTINDLL